MADWLNLEGKVVIVTGGASGIGNHVVSTLKDAGATPVIADISVETGEERDGIFCTKCDVTSKESVEAMVAAVVEKYGKLDAIVNNAGVNLPRLLVDVQGEKPQYELDEKSFNIMFNINVKGLMYCAQAAAKQMLKQGGGVIINMSSESGKEGSQGQSAYSATKGACDSFTRSATASPAAGPRSWANTTSASWQSPPESWKQPACAHPLTTKHWPTPAA